MTTAHRLELLPDLPTVAETLPGYEAAAFTGVGVPTGTPQVIIERLNHEVNIAVRAPDMVAKLAAQGISPAGGTAEEFQNLIAAEIRNWIAVARAANIKAE